MIERMKEKSKVVVAAVWSHRMMYAGLAGAYVAACCGVDKEVVQQIVAALFVAIVVKG